jgi:hypothetical protein
MNFSLTFIWGDDNSRPPAEKTRTQLKKLNISHFFSKRFTFMVVPHGAGTPKQINIPVSFIVVTLAFWTLVTGWGSYLSARHVDYWRTQLSNQVLTLKVNYLVNQLDSASGFLDQVKQIEYQLQNLLKFSDEASLIKATIQNEKKPESTGGPTLRDQNDVTALLKLGVRDISWERLVEKSNFLNKRPKVALPATKN